MVEFPYMETAGGIARPVIAILLEGPTGTRLIDGLVDSGADRTIFPEREASQIGVELPPVTDGKFKTAGGVTIPYRTVEVVLELRVPDSTIRWKSAVAFAPPPLRLIHFGMAGFLEFFHATFRGPERRLLLEPQSVLPTC